MYRRVVSSLIRITGFIVICIALLLIALALMGVLGVFYVYG